jgi:hypothetical protein
MPCTSRRDLLALAEPGLAGRVPVFPSSLSMNFLIILE